MKPPRLNGDCIIFPGVVVAEDDFAGWTVQTYARKITVPWCSHHGPTVRLSGWTGDMNPGNAPSLIGREVEVAVSRFAEDQQYSRCMYEPGVLE
jgi:hypothetical protein